MAVSILSGALCVGVLAIKVLLLRCAFGTMPLLNMAILSIILTPSQMQIHAERTSAVGAAA